MTTQDYIDNQMPTPRATVESINRQAQGTANWKLALRDLRQFVGPGQLACLRDMCGEDCEEREFFQAKAVELAGLIANMPKNYEQDGKGDEAIATLHYFKGGADFWITEKDMGVFGSASPTEEADLTQHQAFGLVDLGYGPELGYISIVGLLANGVELDFHFTPCTLAEIQAKQAA